MVEISSFFFFSSFSGLDQWFSQGALRNTDAWLPPPDFHLIACGTMIFKTLVIIMGS